MKSLYHAEDKVVDIHNEKVQDRIANYGYIIDLQPFSSLEKFSLIFAYNSLEVNLLTMR